MEILLSFWPWILVKIKLENPEKWQSSAENGPENPENGVKKARHPVNCSNIQNLQDCLVWLPNGNDSIWFSDTSIVRQGVRFRPYQIIPPLKNSIITLVYAVFSKEKIYIDHIQYHALITIWAVNKYEMRTHFCWTGPMLLVALCKTLILMRKL